MKPTLLLVADGARCRLISVKSSENESFEPIVELIECDALANPEALLPGQSIYTEAKSGRNRSHPGGPAHGYDDHRDRHHDEMLRRFARDIIAHTERAMKDNDLAQVILIANPRLLGFLREQVPSRLQPRIVAIFEEDASKKNVDELRRLLARRGVVGARHAQAVHGARGQLN